MTRRETCQKARCPCPASGRQRSARRCAGSKTPPLLTGQGRYTDDVNPPGQLFAQFVRSPHAHGILRRIDVAAATAMPGVVAVITGEELAQAGYGSLRCTMAFTNADGLPMRGPERASLATDKVRFVGDPVNCVVAESRAAARDAAEAVLLDIEPLPAVTEASAAAVPGAPVLYDSHPDNVVLDFHHGDRDAVAAAFTEAAHVVRLALRNNSVVVCAMEPRAAVAEYDVTGERFILHVGSQGVWGLRNQLADDLLRVPRERVRVLTGHVGGSFGMKASAYPEYVPLLHAARRAEAARRGRRRGQGIGQYLECTAPPAQELGGIRFDADGGVTIHHRHARLRAGPPHGLRPGAGRCPRRAARGRPPRAERFRRPDRGGAARGDRSR